ncbi:MAG: restriction endonuclease subunit M [Clostridia bacterium]|nr:restriction endonuclease subunit M [Clostridia bacterium]
MAKKIDIKENYIFNLDSRLLDILLKDRTTGSNILWATDNYEHLGLLYNGNKPILPSLITGNNAEIIKPRVMKPKTEQQSRIRDKAEVFTPLWVCNRQNNLIDEGWFGVSGVFNKEQNKSWITNNNRIDFSLSGGKTWQDYVTDIRLEITCGEAPYLVSRYDTVTGNEIAVSDRIGLLDRKLRVICENVDDKADWYTWTVKAFQSIYGYEWKGDNLLLARLNLLYTFIDYYKFKFKEKPAKRQLSEIAEIISWNIWQMDGLKFVVPNSCINETEVQLSLLAENRAPITCLGCAKNNPHKHNGIYCKIKNWETKRAVKFVSFSGGKK